MLSLSRFGDRDRDLYSTFAKHTKWNPGNNTYTTPGQPQTSPRPIASPRLVRSPRLDRPRRLDRSLPFLRSHFWLQEVDEGVRDMSGSSRARHKGSAEAFASALQKHMPVPSFLAYTESLSGAKDWASVLVKRPGINAQKTIPLAFKLPMRSGLGHFALAT